MTPQNIIQFGFGAVFTLGLVMASWVAFRRRHHLPPISKADLLRRSAIRLGCCTLPYLLLAFWLRAFNGNDVLFHGFWFWFAVILVPGLGLAVDVSRLPADPKPSDRNA